MSGSRPFNRILPPSPVAVQGPHAELLSCTVLEFAAMIRGRELSSRELTSACLERIEALDGAETLNAFILSRGEDGAGRGGPRERAGRWRARRPVAWCLRWVSRTPCTPRASETGRTRSQWDPETGTTACAVKEAGAIVSARPDLHESGSGYTSPQPATPPGSQSIRFESDSRRVKRRIRRGRRRGAVPSGSRNRHRRICPHPPALCGGVGLKPTLGRASRGGMFGLSWATTCSGPSPVASQTQPC